MRPTDGPDAKEDVVEASCYEGDRHPAREEAVRGSAGFWHEGGSTSFAFWQGEFLKGFGVDFLGEILLVSGVQALAIILAIAIVVVIWKFTFRFFFDDQQDFWECFRFSCTPDLLSMFRGEYMEDMGKSFKFTLYVWCGLGAGLLTYFGLGKLFGF